MLSAVKSDSTVQSQVWRGRPIGGSSPLTKGPNRPKGLDCGPQNGSACAVWPKNLRRVVRMTCVSGGWSVCRRSSRPTRKCVIYAVDTTMVKHIQSLPSDSTSYRDGVRNTSKENASCHQQGHAGSKTLLQQNPPVLNWGCWLTQTDLNNGCKRILCVCVTAACMSWDSYCYHNVTIKHQY